MTPPVGLAGELTMSSRVRGVISFSVSSAENAKPFSSRIGTGTGLRAGELDHRAVDRKAGIGIEDLGARLAEHQDRHEHGRLAAGHDHHLVGRDLDAEALVQIGGDRLAQRRDAVRRRVAVVAVAQRLDRGLDDEIGRAEIGLADAEIDDVAALRGQRVGARQHREGVFLADAVESGDGLEHILQSSRRRCRSQACPPPRLDEDCSSADRPEKSNAVRRFRRDLPPGSLSRGHHQIGH